MTEHKTKAHDSRTGDHEKKDAKEPMDYEEAKAKGHADQQQRGHSHEKGKGPRRDNRSS